MFLEAIFVLVVMAACIGMLMDSSGGTGWPM